MSPRRTTTRGSARARTILCAGVLGLAWAAASRLATNDPGTTFRESASPSERSARPRPRTHGGSAWVARPGDDEDPLVDPAADAGAPITRPDRLAAAPVAHEEAGYLAESRERWEREPEDVAASLEVERHVLQMLEDFHIAPTATSVSCTASICRAELEFSTYAELTHAGTLPADGSRIRLGASVDGTPRAVAYWDRDSEDRPF